MPDLCAFYGNPYTRYATNIRIWALFPYLLKSFFYWQMPLIQIHSYFKCWRSWSQLVSKPRWPTSKLTKCMPLEAKVIVSDELLWLYEIKSTYMKFLDKLLGLLVLLNNIKEKYVVRSILRNTIDKAKMLRFKVSVTLKAFSINQYCSTSIWNILSQITLEFIIL